jgi:hypothetical protein
MVTLFILIQDICGNVFTRHVVYDIEIKYHSKKSWNVKKRYTDFLELHQNLQKKNLKLPEFPPKYYIGNFENDKLVKRKSDLEEYMKIILSDEDIRVIVSFIENLGLG